jgi:hypothetical protein
MHLRLDICNFVSCRRKYVIITFLYRNISYETAKNLFWTVIKGEEKLIDLMNKIQFNDNLRVVVR